MCRNKKYSNITLKQEDRELLEKLAKSQTAQYRKVQRAKILLMSADGMPNSDDEEKAWITNIACTKPKDSGLAEELWTYRSLQKYEIKPNKTTYYLERKDPDFESKMHDILVVYKQIFLCFDDNGNFTIPMDEPKTVTVSYDEKPGIQARKNIAPDLPPTPGHDMVARDYEYRRLGTVYLLAGMDLLTGEIVPLVSSSHKSSDFIAFFKKAR